MQTKAKILFLDIETFPAEVYTFQLRDQNIPPGAVIHDSYMLCWSAKWLGESKVYMDSLPAHKTIYKVDPRNEKGIALSMWKLLDKADIIVAHNGDNFDNKWLTAVFIKYKMPPPSHFKTVDTCKASRAMGYQLSHTLQFLCEKLDIGHKLKHEGFSLWVKCGKGNMGAWKRMLNYNKKDIELLEKLYLRLRPHMKNHPNLAIYADKEGMHCILCGGVRFKKKGFAYSQVNKFQRYICLTKGCGKNVRGNKPIKTNREKVVSVK